MRVWAQKLRSQYKPATPWRPPAIRSVLDLLIGYHPLDRDVGFARGCMYTRWLSGWRRWLSLWLLFPLLLRRIRKRLRHWLGFLLLRPRYELGAKDVGGQRWRNFLCKQRCT